MPLLGATVGVGVVGTVLSSSGIQRPVVNVFVYRNPNPGGAGTLATFIAAFDLNVWQFVAPLLSSAYSGVSYQGYFPALFDPALATTFPNTRNGAVVGPRLELPRAINVLLRSGLRGKNFMGMKRFGPVPQAHVTGDELNAAGVAAWTAALPLFQLTFTDTFSRIFVPVILSRQLSPPPPPAYHPVGADITSVVLNKTLGTARHRRERTVR